MLNIPTDTYLLDTLVRVTRGESHRPSSANTDGATYVKPYGQERDMCTLRGMAEIYLKIEVSTLTESSINWGIHRNLFSELCVKLTNIIITVLPEK